MDFGRIVGNLPVLRLTSGFFYCKDEIWKFWAKLFFDLFLRSLFKKTYPKKKVSYITVVHLALPGEGDVDHSKSSNRMQHEWVNRDESHLKSHCKQREIHRIPQCKP